MLVIFCLFDLFFFFYFLRDIVSYRKNVEVDMVKIVGNNCFLGCENVGLMIDE